MRYELAYTMILFFIFSVIGYILEIISVFTKEKRIVLSRGYLIGPYIPVFGFGGLIITFFLSNYQDNIITLFVLGVVYCCSLEYFTSYLMEKIFHLRWWDYSYRKYNLNGRICLETGFMFGFGSLFVVKLCNPFVFSILDKLSRSTICTIGLILFIIMFSDFILSTFTIVRLKIDTSKYVNTDATLVIKKEVKESIRKYSFFYKRLFEAFPTLSRDNIYFVKIKQIIDKIVKHKKK